MKEKSHFTCALLIVLMVFVLIFGASPQSVIGADNAGKNSFAGIEEKVRKLMEDGDIPGLCLIIVKDDEPLYIKGFGFADVEKQTPVTPETLFELGSTSKAFTALAVLKCEADGLINLDAPVVNYLPFINDKL